ncbi:hypothetical protein NQ315_006065 [Exocentrus adspersus]|uniref:Uncharacterized protein n=1 Tax=Exocentrus adspersus TaxID=1586481 RepID=A0AAV8VGQ3_9CUCU|nr:hypothetical protein NQ315_006065 [Exocentrus adspersus]
MPCLQYFYPLNNSHHNVRIVVTIIQGIKDSYSTVKLHKEIPEFDMTITQRGFCLHFAVVQLCKPYRSTIALLSWITVKGAEVTEVGLQEETIEKTQQVQADAQIPPHTESINVVDAVVSITEPMPKPSTSKRSAEPLGSKPKKMNAMKELNKKCLKHVFVWPISTSKVNQGVALNLKILLNVHCLQARRTKICTYLVLDKPLKEEVLSLNGSNQMNLLQGKAVGVKFSYKPVM